MGGTARLRRLGLGPDGGASHLPGGMVGSDITAAYKGKDLLVSDYRAMFGLDPVQG